jgi:transmembrane sensor
MTGPATPPDWDAIARYLAGESSASEAAVVRSWLEANPQDRELVHRLDAAATLDTPADVDVEAALGRAHRKLAAAERPSLRLERGGAGGAAKPTRSRVRSIIAVATIAVAAGVAFAVVQNRTVSREPAGASTKHYVAGTGKTDSVLLGDGSRVILGPQSTLEVPGTFGAGERTVKLTGDAYFDVRHDASKPFSVRAGSAVIQDIGTTFTIESDGGDVATVSVVEGSVSLNRADAASTAGVVLAAGDRGSLGAAGDARVERNVVRPEDTAWISGRLAFRDAPLSRVAAEVERWYGVTLVVADSSLLERRVTTSFEGESADKVLQILELTLGAQITRTGDTAVVSSPRGSRTSR